jgi:hypothetical protein
MRSGEELADFVCHPADTSEPRPVRALLAPLGEEARVVCLAQQVGLV